MDDRHAPVQAARLRLRTFQADLAIWPAVAIAERFLAAGALALLFPMLLAAAIVTAILSRRSPFIAHNRVGKGGCELWVLKLRTMWGMQPVGRSAILVERLQVNKFANAVTKINRDPRVTSWFALSCRRYSIDELPQLWQIVRGEMALVGPRPITKHEIETYYGREAKLLLSRKPGLTGLWQVSGRSRLSYPQRRRLDLFMVRNWSLSLYILILARTIFRTPLGKDAW